MARCRPVCSLPVPLERVRSHLMNQEFIYLASASPRRAELLDQIGVGFRTSPVEVDEARAGGESPEDFVMRLAREKAGLAWQAVRDEDPRPVLAADTAVVLGDEVFGKPGDRGECLAMLRSLSGRTHEVLTAVALLGPAGERAELNRTAVTFRALSEAECEAYWATGEPADKAGGYGIQGRGAVFVEHIAGSYSGVVGLPLFETAQMLAGFGLGGLADAAAKGMS